MKRAYLVPCHWRFFFFWGSQIAFADVPEEKTADLSQLPNRAWQKWTPHLRTPWSCTKGRDLVRNGGIRRISSLTTSILDQREYFPHGSENICCRWRKRLDGNIVCRERKI